jgi:hypothetical protein
MFTYLTMILTKAFLSLKAVFQLSVLHMYVYTQKSLMLNG